MNVVDANSNFSPCPFCGTGSFEIKENGRIWLGTRYSDPVSHTLLHWCGDTSDVPKPFSYPLKMHAKTIEEVIAKWNTRV